MGFSALLLDLAIWPLIRPMSNIGGLPNGTSRSRIGFGLCLMKAIASVGNGFVKPTALGMICPMNRLWPSI
ncbi:MAG: hypothetical protein MH252_01415 [Thermosynechococcaceae cyanobacterium MS004]|nr:hypothetical protein [Thermosynechococcaceae cyanobacterium MS004]